MKPPLKTEQGLQLEMTHAIWSAFAMPLFGYSPCVHYFAQRIHVHVSFLFSLVFPSLISRFTRNASFVV